MGKTLQILLPFFWLLIIYFHGLPVNGQTVTPPTFPSRQQIQSITTNGDIKTSLKIGNIIYFGGNFSEVRIADKPILLRKNLAAFDTTTQTLISWDPQPNQTVLVIHQDNDILYVGGEFTMIGKEKRAYVAGFTLSDGMLNKWSPRPNRGVYTIQTNENLVIIGGAFTQINEVERRHLAFFDKPNSVLSPIHFPINNSVAALALSDTTLYIGGGFTQLNSLPRTALAAMDIKTFQVVDWKPDIQMNLVRVMELNNQVLTVYGFSPTANGLIPSVAQIDTATAEVKQYKSFASEIAASVTPTPLPTNRPLPVGQYYYTDDIELINYTAQLTPTPEPSIVAAKDLMIDSGQLGFRIPSLTEVLTFVIRIFFVIAGLAALIFMLLGAFAWISSGGDKDSITAAREKIQAAVIGLIMVVVVLAIMWTMETVVFRKKICMGLSCPLTIPSLLK